MAAIQFCNPEFCNSEFVGGSLESAKSLIKTLVNIRELGKGGLGRWGKGNFYIWGHDSCIMAGEGFELLKLTTLQNIGIEQNTANG
jgi:hypothetical protein